MSSSSHTNPLAQDVPDTGKKKMGTMRDVSYQPIPDPSTISGMKGKNVWRIRFESVTEADHVFGLDINGDCTVGRGETGSLEHFNLNPYGAGDMGVSRRHAMLHPTPEKLYISDLGSTNGTRINGKSIGVNSPYSLNNGDILALGFLQFVVRIVQRPSGYTAMLTKQADLAAALAQIARSLTSQLELSEVLSQALEMATALTDAGEASIWLVDEQSGDLILKAQRGMDESDGRAGVRLRGSSTLVSEVIRTGLPAKASRDPDDEKIKMKTGYLVDSLIYVPLKLANLTFGVLAAANREETVAFTDRDEHILTAIGDFAAIAIQNARLYESTDQALAERVKELSALNSISLVVSSSLDLNSVYAVLVQQVDRYWDVEGMAMWLADSQTQTFWRFTGVAFAYPPTVHRFRDGIVGTVIASGHAMHSNAVAGSIGYDRDIDTPEEFIPGSMVCVPLLAQGEVVGALALFNKRDMSFQQGDVDQLQRFAAPIATAVRNARLYTASERERATVHKLASSLDQPLIVLDTHDQIMVANEAGRRVLETTSLQTLISSAVSDSPTAEVVIDNATFITSIQSDPDFGSIVVMQDITYMKQLEEARAEFVHALSHDLKGPLTSIRGYAEMIPDMFDLDERGQRFTRKIVEGADRILEMIRQLLDIALLQENPEADHTPTDIVACVKQAIDDLSGAALVQSISIDYQQHGSPYGIIGDERRLQRSLLNLLDNAIKYSPDNSSILVGVGFGPQEVIIKVRDDGDGIPDEDLPHVFERFYRGVQRTSRKMGAGLGLGFVQATIEAHNGTISVANVPGHGAEFTITLPGSLRVA